MFKKFKIRVFWNDTPGPKFASLVLLDSENEGMTMLRNVCDYQRVLPPHRNWTFRNIVV